MRRSVLVLVVLLCGCARNSKSPASAVPPAPQQSRANRDDVKVSDVEASDVDVSDVEASRSGTWTLSGLAQGAKLLNNMGDVQRPVSHKNPEAQALFDQGLALTYGFNHDEAARSFARAAEIDPTCALCFWGIAYTLGPNYNMPLLEERAQVSWEALKEAERTAVLHASPVERALIAALSKRYDGPKWIDPVSMQRYNEAYALAMRDVAKAYPDDFDVQTLYAESLMNLQPWHLWTQAGEPGEHTAEIVQVLERVLANAPQHAGANHLYIHAVEASKAPERALPSAIKLPGLVPGAGHIVHMPAHIYQRVGRYADAAEANRKAIVTDKAYLDEMTPIGYYPFYLAHNYGFLAFAATMLGRSQEALEAARVSAQNMPHDMVCGMPGMDFFLSAPLFVMVRFGLWDQILNEPKPDAKHAVLLGLWHHAEGMARAGKGEVSAAIEHAEAIRELEQSLPNELRADQNSAHQVLLVAAKVVDARAAEVAKKPSALALWREAVALEDALSYAEPDDWFYPVRHYLGAALLDAGKAQEAEAVYRRDLEEHPHNGWALFGLSRALEQQKKTKQAKEAKQAYESAFRDADVKLARSAF